MNPFPLLSFLWLKSPLFSCAEVEFMVVPCRRNKWNAILFPHYAKYIWATTMLTIIMNVSTFAENLVKKYISFLLRSIPLTTKLWFKIHNLRKSRTSLNKIVQSSDVQTFWYSNNTLCSFNIICQISLFKNQICGRQRTRGFPFHWDQLQMEGQTWGLPSLTSQRKGESKPILQGGLGPLKLGQPILLSSPHFIYICVCWHLAFIRQAYELEYELHFLLLGNYPLRNITFTRS